MSTRLETPRTSAMVAKPRLGFLGVGWIGRNRLEAIARSGLVEITAIADPALGRTIDLSDIVPDAARLESLDELLDIDLDGVVIATPSALHAEQSIQALERGLAVFCQKPLGRTADEARRVVAAARAADRLLGVDLSYRFVKGVQAIRERVRAGELGRIYAIDLVFHNAYGPDKPWFYDPTLSGGGCVLDLGTHLVDLAFWVLDWPRVREVSSRLFVRGEPLRRLGDRSEDYAIARLDLDDGTVVRLACSWNLPAGCDCVIEASFYGVNGGASLRNVRGSFYDFVAERFHGTARETLAEPPDEWGGRAAVDWARRLAAGHGFDPEVERAVDVAAALDAIYGR
jgi:predicted dehydrogenase